MSACRLLFLDAISLTAYRWQGGHLHFEQEFAADVAGYEALGEYVAKQRGSPIHLLADIAEEGFQLEDVPYVAGADRKALIQRKLAQYFYGTPYALAVSLGRQKTGRRDERMLFTALTRPQQVEPWLAALHAAEAELAGVYGVPMVSAALAALLAPGNPRFLLISITRGGLRQTLFENGQIVFSRLTTLVTDATNEMARACAAESEKMYQYMAGQRLVARGTQLTTLVLVHPVQLGAFRDSCLDTGTIHFEFVDILPLAAKLGLKTPPKDSRSEALFMHLLARRPPREQFSPPADRHLYRIGQMRFALRAAGFTIFTACLLFAGRQAIEYHQLSQRAAETMAQTASDRGRYDAILQALPKIPLSNDNLRALTSRYDTLLARSAGPVPMYLAVGRALQNSPAVELTRLEWTLGAPKDAKAAPAVAATVSPAPTFSGAIAGSIDIQAQLPPALAGDARAQLAAIESFAAQLRSGQLQVQILKLPFEAESSKVLKSGSQAVSNAGAPQFALRASMPQS